MHNHNSALELVRPLSHDRDLLVAARLLSIINPQRIVELGAGNGDWLVYIAHQLANPQLELIGVLTLLGLVIYSV